MRQLGPWLDGKPGASNGVFASPRSGRGSELRPMTWARFSITRWCTLPHVHFFGSAPSCFASFAVVLLKALRKARVKDSRSHAAVGQAEATGALQLGGVQTVFPASASVSRYCPSASFISERSTGTFFAFHQGSQLCAMYSCQNVHQIVAAAESISIRQSQAARRSSTC